MNWPLLSVCLFAKWPSRPAPSLPHRIWPALSARPWPPEAEILGSDLGLRRSARGWIAKQADRGWEPFSAFCPGYPFRLRERLQGKAPPLLWRLGAASCPGRWAAIVGSRSLAAHESKFAFEAGRLLAGSGFMVVSGGAKGSDFQGVAGCLSGGGFGCHILPGGEPRSGKLASALFSEAPWEKEFDRISALRRNRWVYAMSDFCLVCASRLGEGGSWHGAVAARRERLTRVVLFCPDSESCSEGNFALQKIGFESVASAEQLQHLIAALPSVPERPSQSSLAV